MLEKGVLQVLQPQEGEGTPCTLQSSLAASAAGLPVGELEMSAPVPPLLGPHGCLMKERRCTSTPESPQHQANVTRHHEKLEFMGLKEKQHLGRNYCNLKGGCRPVPKSEIWKQCLIFFFSWFVFQS